MGISVTESSSGLVTQTLSPYANTSDGAASLASAEEKTWTALSVAASISVTELSPVSATQICEPSALIAVGSSKL